MTPQEKAAELLNNLYEINCNFFKADTTQERSDRYKLLIPLCKANAIFAVDEILNKDGYNSDYWKEVKVEIEKTTH